VVKTFHKGLKVIKTNTIEEAWIQAIHAILNEGVIVFDENDELIERLQLLLIIMQPELDETKAEVLLDKSTFEWMMKNFAEKWRVPELGNAKSYGWRFYDYYGKDQHQWVIEKLSTKPESKSATVTMLMPNEDASYVPCVSQLDFKIRNESLVLTASCRSLDFGKKALANMYALTYWMKSIADALVLKKTQLVLHVISAHIYRKDRPIVIEKLRNHNSNAQNNLS
jgi:thymidylate synthase